MSVSVIITSYNHGRYLEKTVKSALAQTLPPLEVVVVDDCSTDNSVDILKSISDPRLRILQQSRNQGPSIATNHALSEARGEYIALLGSDDLFLPHKLAAQMEHMQAHLKTDICFTRPILISAEGKAYTHAEHPHYRHFLHANRTRAEWLRELCDHGNRFCAPSAMLRRSVITRTGLFNPAMLQLQDYDYWLRAAIAGCNFHVLDEPLTQYRFDLNGNNLSAARAPVRRRAFMEHVQILKELGRITALEDVFAVFPHVPKSYQAQAPLIPFYVASGLCGHKGEAQRAAGAELLFSQVENMDTLQALYTAHGITMREIYALLAQHPLAERIDRSAVQHMKRMALKLLPAKLEQKLRHNHLLSRLRERGIIS